MPEDEYTVWLHKRSHWFTLRATVIPDEPFEVKTPGTSHHDTARGLRRNSFFEFPDLEAMLAKSEPSGASTSAFPKVLISFEVSPFNFGNCT